MLWRRRQQNGEVAFKFENYVGADKEPEEAEYAEGMFEDLGPAARIEAHDPQDRLCGNSQGEEEEEDSDDYSIRRRRSGGSDSSEEERSDETNKTEQGTHRQRGKETINEEGLGEALQALKTGIPRRTRTRMALSPTQDEDSPRQVRPRTNARAKARKAIISEEDDAPQELVPSTPNTLQHTEQVFNSSPTLAGSSPCIEKPIRGRQLNKTSTAQRKALPTPGPSQASTPAVPDGTRELRSKAAAAAKESEATKIKTRSRGKVQGGRIKKG